MPNVEIISVRFNLEKDEDRRLFEELQKRSDPGKRNEFLKKVLLECLTADRVSVKPAARSFKRQTKEQAEPPDKRLQHTGGTAGAPEPDPEAAGLVGSFVQ